MSSTTYDFLIRKTLVLALGVVFTISLLGFIVVDTRGYTFYSPRNNAADNREISTNTTMSRLKEKAALAKDYIDNKGFDVSYCFMIDMRLPSGKNRFFIYNLLKDSVEAAGLVTHGKGSESETGELIFSNTPNSKCTSLGKYKIGDAYNGNFGLSYKLMGLDKTNSKALGRSVVLHSYCGIPKQEVYPAPICVSEGCPAVSPAFFTQLKTIMDESQEPILLWIFY
jgi:hypothetical protein